MATKNTEGEMKKTTWRKSPPELIAQFKELVAVLPPDAEPRKMFGYPCVFVERPVVRRRAPGEHDAAAI